MKEKELVKRALKESAALKLKVAKELSGKIIGAAELIISAFKTGKKVLLFGNGGSAADAQHLAAELVGRFKKERAPLAAIALNSNTSVITAISNDYRFEDIFAKQIEALAIKDDVVIGITTSGNSANIIKALKVAKSKKTKTISLLGSGGGKLKGFADVEIIVPSWDTPRIQEAQITIGHIICELVEESLLGK